jgi:hypothetical protein
MPGWLFDSVALIDWYCGRSGIAPYVDKVLLGNIQGAFSTITESSCGRVFGQARKRIILPCWPFSNESLSTALSPSRRGACDNRWG